MNSVKYLNLIIITLSILLAIASWRYIQILKTPPKANCYKELIDCSSKIDILKENFLHSINWDNVSLNPDLIFIDAETNKAITIENFTKPRLIFIIPEDYCESCINQQLFILKSKFDIRSNLVSIFLPCNNAMNAKQICIKLAIPFSSYYMETPYPELFQVSKPYYFYMDSSNKINSPYFVEENNSEFISSYIDIISHKLNKIEKSPIK